LKKGKSYSCDDIGETRNLAGLRPTVTQHLHGLLCAWREEMEALEPEVNPDWR